MKTAIEITAYEVAERFLGFQEAPGAIHNPAILAMMRLDASWVEDDETPWCSGFANAVAWLLGLPRSNSVAARSWLRVGEPVALEEALRGFDVVVLQRGGGRQPGPEVLAAPGHVGFFTRLEGDLVYLLGGNQGNRVTVAPFPVERVLGVRRLLV